MGVKFEKPPEANLERLAEEITIMMRPLAPDIRAQLLDIAARIERRLLPVAAWRLPGRDVRYLR